MTPDQLADGGAQLRIRHGRHPSPFGPMFLAQTPRGVCALYFPLADGSIDPVQRLRRRWPAATLIEDPAAGAGLARSMFAGALPDPVSVQVSGTAFQRQVWEALLEIPFGSVLSYGQLAARLGRPRASRPVGGAVGANPVSWLIPCHRVVRTGGALGGYHWGLERKRQMLAWEAARRGD